MVENQSPSGLWKRQSSLLPDESNAPESLSVETSMENDSGGSAPLLEHSSASPELSSSTPQGLLSKENIQIYSHIVAGFLCLLAGTSIGPLFSAVAKESLRTENIPFQKTAAGDIILDLDLNYPVTNPATVPAFVLTYTCVVSPFIFLLFVNFYNCIECKRNTMGRVQMHELRASLCAFFTSIGLSEGVTNTLKLYVSRHRPNFYALCGFDTATLKCTAPLANVREATLSFPSGHSSVSFCGMTFLMYYLRGRVAMITPSSSIAIARKTIRLQPYKMLLHTLCCLVPWSYSVFIATSRIVDKWHHPSDVLAGTLLGITAATIGYHAFYPNVGSSKAGIPLSLQQSNIASE